MFKAVVVIYMMTAICILTLNKIIMSAQIYQISSLTIENEQVKKVSNVKNIIIATCCMFLSVALVVAASRMPLENEVATMFMLTCGGLLFVFSLYMFINKSKKFVYTPTNSKLNHLVFYVEQSQLLQAERWAAEGYKSSVDFTTKCEGNTRFDILLSDDRQFVAIQLSVYENFRYNPCGKVGYLYGAEVESLKSIIG
jgi:hypothetical protein